MFPYRLLVALPSSFLWILRMFYFLWWNRKWIQCSICSRPTEGGSSLLLQAIRSWGSWCSRVFWWTCHICRHFIRPIFPGQSQSYGFWRALSRWPTKFCSGRQISRVFPSHKNTTFLTRCTNILAFPLWEKTPIGVGQQSTSRQQEGRGEREENM